MTLPPHLILLLTPLLILLSLPQARAQTDLSLFSILLPNASTVALANTQYSIFWTQPLTVTESEPIKFFFQLKDYRNDEPQDPMPLKPLSGARLAKTKTEAHLYPFKVDESKADLRGVVGGRYSVWMVRLGDRKVLARSEEFVIKAQFGAKVSRDLFSSSQLCTDVLTCRARRHPRPSFQPKLRCSSQL